MIAFLNAMIPRAVFLIILLLIGMGAWPLVAKGGTPGADSVQAASAAIPTTALRIRRHLVDFGTIPFGSCVRDSFTVENVGLEALTLAGAEIVRDTAGRVAILQGIDGIQLPRNRFVILVLEFCAKDYGCAEIPIVIRAGDGESDTVIVRGCTREPDFFLGTDTLDFGLVRHLTSASASYRLVNTQAASIRIIDLYRVAGTDFRPTTEIPAGGITVPFKGSQPLTFLYDATALGRDVAWFRITQDGGWRELMVVGRGGAPQVIATPNAIAFGSVAYGRTADAPVDIVNVGNLPANVSAIAFSTGAFTLAPGERSSFTLAAGEHHPLLVRFTPSSGDRSYRDSLIVIDDGEGPSATVQLSGDGYDLSGRVIWLDTTIAPVTGIATLALHAAPGILPAEHVRSLRFRIGYRPTALELIGAATGEDGDRSATLVSLDDSTAEITLNTTGADITGENLLDLTFRSFSTATPENVVTLENVMTLALLDSVLNIPCRSGLVLLTGCGIGTITSATKRVRIDGIELEPGASAVVIHYTAPAGADGWARLVDLNGAEVLRVALPVSDGAARDLRLALPGVAGGCYLVQVRAGDDAVAMPLMVLP